MTPLIELFSTANGRILETTMQETFQNHFFGPQKLVTKNQNFV